MGEASGTMTKKQKKKGRPSLLDLQKRFIKQQNFKERQQRNPNSFNLSRNPSSRETAPEWISGCDDEDERKVKNNKLVLGLDSRQHNPTLTTYSLSLNVVSYCSDPNADGEDPDLVLKRRKINDVYPGSNEMGEKVLKATECVHHIHESQAVEDSGPTTPLPDKKLLVFILERLQKKDTHGVFLEPVDQKELPDYHDIIESPMDFGTVRKKLDRGTYASLEQFEEDIFLICSNAMQYNAPDTIYFRQARSMLALAKKDFENLRQDSDDGEPQPKVVSRGRPPRKNLRKSLEPPRERIGAEASSGATLASGEDNDNGSKTYNLRRGASSFRFQHGDSLLRRAFLGPQNSETWTSWLPEWENEFPASVLKSAFKYGKNHQVAIDENRRYTYKQSLASEDQQSVFTTFNGELRQLTPVGVHLNHSYASSLAQFAADLGPIVWKIASKKIASVLPIGVESGPSWVEERETSKQQHSLLSDEDNYPRISFSCREDKETIEESNYQSDIYLNKGGGYGMKPSPQILSNKEPLIGFEVNGIKGEGLHHPHPTEMRMVSLATLTGNHNLNDTSVPSQMLVTDVGSNSFICKTMASDVDGAEWSRISSRSCSGNSLAQTSALESSHKEDEVRFGEKTSWQGWSTSDVHDSFPFAPNVSARSSLSMVPSSKLPVHSPTLPDLMLQL